MTARKLLPLLIPLLLAGCSEPDNDRLTTGDKVIAFEHDYGNGTKYDRVYLEKTGESMWPDLPYGTHLSVVSDGKDPEKKWSTRDVLVHVEDGPFKGKTGTLTRWNLRKSNW